MAIEEGKHTGEFLLSSQGNYSLDEVTISSTAGAIAAGTVLGRIRGAVSTAAVGTNTGNGAIGTVTAGAGAREGDYKLVILEPAADGGAFVVENPDGAVIGHGTVGAAFTGGGLGFTLADGATDFAAGDTIKITVAKGTKYAAYDADGTDGTEIARCIAYANTPDSTADQKAVAVTRQAEVLRSALTGLDVAGEASLNAAGIVVRG